MPIHTTWKCTYLELAITMTLALSQWHGQFKKRSISPNKAQNIHSHWLHGSAQSCAPDGKHAHSKKTHASNRSWAAADPIPWWCTLNYGVPLFQNSYRINSAVNSIRCHDQQSLRGTTKHTHTQWTILAKVHTPAKQWKKQLIGPVICCCSVD